MQSEAWLKSGTKELYTKTWSPESAKATLVFVHGLGEHICRYNEMFTAFSNAGIKTTAFDQRGFGQTVRKNGSHGRSEGVEQTMADIKLVSQAAKVEGLPHFIMGHSMGGFLALRYANLHQDEFKGVVASAPMIRAGSGAAPNFIELGLLHVLPHIIPSFALPSKLDVNNISRDPAEVEIYKTDPLIHPMASLGLLADILFGGKALLSVTDFKLPILIAHGTADKLTCPIASKQFIDNISSADKTHKLFPGFFHELHNEPTEDRKVVIATYTEWIVKHM